MRMLLAALIFAATNAQAANWVVIAQSTQSQEIFDIWQMDASSVVIRDGLRQAWIRHSASPPQPIYAGGKEFHQSVVSLGLFDCTYKETADVQYTMYSEPFSQGVAVKQDSRNRDRAKQDLKVVTPGTFNESILKAVCSARLNKS